MRTNWTEQGRDDNSRPTVSRRLHDSREAHVIHQPSGQQARKEVVGHSGGPSTSSSPRVSWLLAAVEDQNSDKLQDKN